MKNRHRLWFTGFLCGILCVMLCGCAGRQTGGEEEAAAVTSDEGKKITVGFSQLGAESDWRRKNTESMLSAFEEADEFELLYENGQQEQNNQIRAIRKFIQQEVDYIVLAPVTETGWETVLGEAKEAGIPVVLVDRMADVKDESLYSCWVGSDFELEGKKVVAWLKAFTDARGIDPSFLHVVNIQGTQGSSAQIGRTNSLREGAEEWGWNLTAEISGDFTQTKAREVMESLIHLYSDINVVYCENDNEALGAIEALEEAEKTVGSDLPAGEVMVLSFDGVKKEAREYVLEDRISCIGECNPDQGPLVLDLIRQMEEGKTPEKRFYTEEGIFSSDDTVKTVTVDNVEYPVTPMTPELAGESDR